MRELTNLKKMLEDLKRHNIDTEKIVVETNAVHLVSNENPIFPPPLDEYENPDE